MNDQGNHLDSSTVSLKSYRSFKGPLFRKPVTNWSGTFFKVSYSNLALEAKIFQFVHRVRISSKANCKMGIGPLLLALKLKICRDWKHFAVRFNLLIYYNLIYRAPIHC